MSETTMTAMRPTEAFRDPSTLTLWAVGLFGVALAVDFAATISGFFELHLLSMIADGTAEADVEVLTANDMRQHAIGLAQLALFLLSGIAYLMWVYRANKN